VFARGGVLVVVDRDTGREHEIRVAELGGTNRPDLELRDGVAYVASWLPDATAAIAFAVGLDDGRVRWRRRLPTASGLVATGHAVYVLTTGGVLHALDRETGAPFWQWSIGRPHVRLVAGTLGDERVFVIRDDAVVAFAVRGPPPPFEDAVIRTKLTRMCPNDYHTVTVGDAEAPVRKNGDVEAHVHARGTVYVQAPDGDGREVELIGHRDYRLAPLESSPCDAP
jgi:putative pyrroloquinoline-quinone binding quinoprotein